MLNCPCGFGKNINDSLNKCPVCGMDLAPLKKVAHVEAKMDLLKNVRLSEVREYKQVKIIITTVVLLLLSLTVTSGIIMLQQEKEPELTVEPSIELISTELEQLFSSIMQQEELDVVVRYTNDVIEISGEVPTAFHKDIITAFATEKAGTERVNISSLNIIPLQDNELIPLEDNDDKSGMVFQMMFHYRVVPGDTLSKIARIFYGDYNKWGKIFDANQDQLSDYNNINVGQILKVPLEIDKLSLLNKKQHN